MELDISDVSSEAPELEEREKQEKPEREELYESAEPPRRRNRGIDDSIIHAHGELLKAYLSIPSRISKRNSELSTCRDLLEGYRAENIIRQNEANIEQKMRRFENDEKEFVERYIKPLIELLRAQPTIKCIPENKEVMELYERRHELEELIKRYEEDPNLMVHGEEFLKYFHERVWQEHFVKVQENIDWCEDDIEECKKLREDLKIMLVNSGIILRGRGIPMRRIDDRGNPVEN
ncbi:uncharacterized protein EAF01_001916 [Botrytis porri]|uniref:Uncharacterized protein n=1 Tax=Botrytis porri TaxID=87229 RepID=A0A4Z1KYZ3_9HELO|nr:uncharacterized protein EAF01_001916 [Botrytis porri]KAF7912895.1 hypothetical protein EAF01_001916 [Botrytis porri]TGO89772.1 hypothetical protein BPOR_0094g00070 [Botrytis porri]